MKMNITYWTGQTCLAEYFPWISWCSDHGLACSARATNLQHDQFRGWWFPWIHNQNLLKLSVPLLPDPRTTSIWKQVVMIRKKANSEAYSGSWAWISIRSIFFHPQKWDANSLKLILQYFVRFAWRPKCILIEHRKTNAKGKIFTKTNQSRENYPIESMPGT